MADFNDLPEEVQDGIRRGTKEIEAGRYDVIHVEEPRLPTTEEVREAWVEASQLPHYEYGNPNNAPSTDELEEEFNEWYESIRSKAWLDGWNDHMKSKEKEPSPAVAWRLGFCEASDWMTGLLPENGNSVPKNPFEEQS